MSDTGGMSHAVNGARRPGGARVALDRLGIRWLVLLPLLAVSLFATCLTIYLNVFLSELNSEYSALLQVNVVAALEAAEVQVVSATLPAVSFQELAELDEDRMRDLIAQIGRIADEGADRIVALRRILSHQPIDFTADLDTLHNDLLNATAIALRAANISLLNNGDASAQALQIMTTQFLPISSALRLESGRFGDRLTHAMQTESMRLAGQVATARVRSVAAALVAILGAVAVGVWIAMSLIVRPIRNLTATMQRLAKRDWAADIMGTDGGEEAGSAAAAALRDGVIPALGRRDEVGSMARAVAVFRDGLMRAEALSRQQRATKIFLDTVLEHVPAPIFVKNATDMKFILVNGAAEVFSGLSREMLIGMTDTGLQTDARLAAMHARDMAALTTTKAMIDDGVLMNTVNKGERLVVITRVAIASASGAPEYLLSMMQDVTERKQAEQRIAYMAHYDTLTDLPNRSFFTERLTEAIDAAHKDGSLVSVLCLDLDHFKEVNDTLGHAAGDILLCAAAARLRRCLRGSDTLARLGGDEFAVIQGGLSGAHEVEMAARRLVETIREPFAIEGHQVFVSLSVGMALSTPGLAGSELVKQADMALYDAKEGGRDCSRWFAPIMDARLHQRRTLQNDLRAAVGTSQLAVYFQPQVNLDSRAILGAEALMRWRHPDQGAIPPSTFVPLAEETGLIGVLGEWLLEQACSEAVRWPAHLSIAVNISPLQLRAANFLGTIEHALQISGLDPRRLELEVTEGILLRDTKATLDILSGLRGLGVKLSLDDFGTGYSSLSYLQKFRFDKLKIDRSFIVDIDVRDEAAAIVRAVVQLSDALGMQTVVEGVENAAEAKALRRLGCTVAQGFYVGRPADAPSMRSLVELTRSVTTAPVAL